MTQQRQCVILEGDAQWCLTSSLSLLAGFENSNTILLSSEADNNFLTISQKQALHYLGKEFDAVIFDALEEFNSDSLGAIIGTIRQGGVLIIWLKDQQDSLWLQRFKRIAKEFEQQHANFNIIQQRQALPQLSLPEVQQPSNEIYFTEDQQQAVEAIKRVVHGHRRRPLVLSADRGRGKSASLGIAAAQLLAEGKQNILVTAPSLSIAETVFEHAARLLPDANCSAGLLSFNKAELRFIAPDALIESDLKADLVLVDEAAAIPASMLERLLQKYSRLVFATTLHGYEGTGRGFAVRFQKILDKKTADWHSYRMATPIRWADDDMLEAFSFQSLLLNAVPVADDLIADAEIEQCQIALLDKKQLMDDEQSLSELFGLMVLAHYRTRPSDLQMLLDRDDITLIVVRYRGHIIASAWLVNEGELDVELSQAVYEGKRRLKGHLLPQSLLAHAGIMSAGSLRYQRVVRVAVHPAVQLRNIGQELLSYCVKQATENGFDIIGTSFAMTDNLISFWDKSAFEFVRLGIHRDEVSGSHSVMMLRALSDEGKAIVEAAKQRFQQHWPHLLQRQFDQLAADQVLQLSQLLGAPNTELKDSDKQEIIAFAYGQRGYEFSQVTMWKWLSQQVTNPKFLILSHQQQSLCVQSLLQNRPWADIAKNMGYVGKTQAVTALREAIATLIKLTFENDSITALK
ncbi:MAG: tRNA cytosine(34) acetyltransferase TmcA [Methylophaga sp.]|nr:MAG: tRNA cytosine(34) acetyltransferase TmcA [Methylophaga sp.]